MRRGSGPGVTASLVFLLGVAALTAAPASEAAPSQRALEAASRGAQWLIDGQRADGLLRGGPWALTAVAAAGRHPADLSSNGGPSAQDQRVASWTANGAGGNGAGDFAREILIAHAAGVDPQRIAPQVNFLSGLADLYDGLQFGSAGFVNDDLFAALALQADKAPAPLTDAAVTYIRARQNPDGGWHWLNLPVSDVDMTGSGLAVLCQSGAGLTDPQVLRATTFLKTVQDLDTGGFRETPPLSAVNADSTGWVVSGLNACGIDPEGFTTGTGKSPVDFLLSLQLADGGFRQVPGNGPANPLSTIHAVRALAGAAFTAEPPERPNGGPRFRMPPAVEPPTTVKVSLVIRELADAPVGLPLAVSSCEVQVPAGAGLAAALDAAPGDCMLSWTQGQDENGRPTIAELNGVPALSAGPLKTVWQVDQKGRPPTANIDAAVAFGDCILIGYRAGAAGGEPSTCGGHGANGGSGTGGGSGSGGSGAGGSSSGSPAAAPAGGSGSSAPDSDSGASTPAGGSQESDRSKNSAPPARRRRPRPGRAGSLGLGSEGGSPPRDRIPPRARITRPANGRTYRRAPGRIAGVVVGSEVDEIRVRLRRVGGRPCAGRAARRRRAVRRSCRGRWRKVGRRRRWSLRLGRRLPPGRYVVQVSVSDRAGNRDTAASNGRTRIRFRVVD